MGNSAFGSQLLDRTKFTRTKYLNSEHECHLAINDPQFRHLKPIGDGLYEMQQAYRRIKLDTPVQIGVNVLMEAKLEMLKWHYNFLSYFITKDMFSHIFMDTGIA